MENKQSNLLKLLPPTDIINGYKIRPGFDDIDGSVMTDEGISFTIRSENAKSCSLHLYYDGEKEEFACIPFPESCHHNNTFSMFVYGLDPIGLEYTYSMDGPYDWKKGFVFNPEKPLLDPYAKAVTGQKEWGKKRKNGKPFEYRARVVKSDFDWEGVGLLDISNEDLIIYEMHIRGFTKHSSSGVVANGTYEGLREKIPYLKKLGINAVELMPIFEFDEMESVRMVNGVQLYNFWGYNTVCFFSPNTGYTYSNERYHEGDELKRTIKELKQNGIAVILDVVFNHTAEGNDNGPTFSFKGIDNNVYYMLTEDGHYYNFSGCGNAMNCNHPSVQKFILDCLRFWVTEFKIDGFRFDLASILTRDSHGKPIADPPIIRAISYDPILSKTKLIAEAWDAGGLYQVGYFPAYGRWSEWNGRYRDDLRRFLKGDDGMAEAAVARITGSQDIYNVNQRGIAASVNFITCHDGFTLWDLYSYNSKHNELNGWGNMDGDNNGHSWNCGVEGETTDENILGLRKRMVKNAFAALFCSRGPVMIYSGDEFCNTQYGNNNAYCQDNDLSWLDWSRLKEFDEINDFVEHMTYFRNKHEVLRKNNKPAQCGYPFISIHNGSPWNSSTTSLSKLIGIMYAGRDAEDTKDDVILYLMNAYWETQKMELPNPPQDMQWDASVCTFLKYEKGQDINETIGYDHGKCIYIPARTTVILVAKSII